MTDLLEREYPPHTRLPCEHRLIVLHSVKSFFRVGEGKIRLEDHVDVERIEKPFQLQPAPRTRELMSVTVVEEAA